MEPWWHESVELLEAGRKAQAIKVVRAAADRGSLGAKVRLARFGEAAGISDDEADAIVEAVVRKAKDDDATAHWNLYAASQLMLGECEPEEKYHRAQHHLELYALSSSAPFAVVTVARRYANGTAVARPDLVKAVDWYFCAVALGDEDAPLELQSLLDEL
jgi:TPR repeat protein